MADKICGDGIGNSTGRLYGAEVELITPNTMYGSSPGEPRTPVQPVDSGGPKKKPTSFQITSVTVQGSRLSNDGGDESADDLDESHTEDLSSDVLDVSKNADQLSPTDENGAADEPPAAAGAPTAGDASSGVPSLPPPTAATTVGAALTIVAGTPASAAPEVPVSPDHWQRRFKVVKIVSSEPFGRGRWLCMDFVDPPAMQGDAKPGDERESAAAGGADLPPAASNEAVAHVYEIPVGQTFPANSQQGGPLYGIILPVSSSAQGPPLGVLQPIAEQPVVTDAPGPGEADPAEPVPENKSTAEEDSERWVPSRPPFAGADLCSEGLSVRRAQPRRCHAPTTALTVPRTFFLHVGCALWRCRLAAPSRQSRHHWLSQRPGFELQCFSSSNEKPQSCQQVYALSEPLDHALLGVSWQCPCVGCPWLVPAWRRARFFTLGS